MKKTVFVMLAMALVPFCAFAVDGVVLINQPTVIITLAGSYRLSGPLIPQLNQMAIQITANEVVLDLNGFNVQCSVGPSRAIFPVLEMRGYSSGRTTTSRFEMARSRPLKLDLGVVET
jgi:hypothetical protein